MRRVFFKSRVVAGSWKLKFATRVYIVWMEFGPKVSMLLGFFAQLMRARNVDSSYHGITTNTRLVWNYWIRVLRLNFLVSGFFLWLKITNKSQDKPKMLRVFSKEHFLVFLENGSKHSQSILFCANSWFNMVFRICSLSKLHYFSVFILNPSFLSHLRGLDLSVIIVISWCHTSSQTEIRAWSEHP